MAAENMNTTGLAAHGLRKSFTSASGTVTEVSQQISLEVNDGHFLAIVGPSGAGKTTLLRMLAGLIAPDEGEVLHRGQRVDGVPDWLSIVFQDYSRSLLPWMTNLRNVALGLTVKSKADRKRRAEEALAKVGLAGMEDRYPWELSGGMQQRVAIARAIVARPAVLLMDEPFASVDAITRGHLEDAVLELWQELGFSTVLITHDIAEAVYMADRILVLSSRPSSVVAEVEVDLPRPRDQVTTRATARFGQYFASVLELVEHGGSAPARRDGGQAEHSPTGHGAAVTTEEGSRT
jgi:NitT/TauT family transport system ATP-binding protein